MFKFSQVKRSLAVFVVVSILILSASAAVVLSGEGNADVVDRIAAEKKLMKFPESGGTASSNNGNYM